ncbi:MAG: DUF4388 domain-containing protein [Myxococcota bacterium]|nr:DUF4388 domain-containing protein [Myxococcota bacterium]
MALKGTLKDFGIADILQLIGQQQKTGILFLRAKEQEVQVGFKDGSIVKAESTTRKKKDLIGNMLVRAEVITEAQLNGALDAQRRTLKRLGDVLVTSKMITPERFREMIQLQATETLYRLFSWKSGTYEFEQGTVEVEGDTITPLRAESVLMEGFRIVDEWPVIKKTISRYDMTFERQKDLPPPRAQKDAFDSALDDVFGDAPLEGPIKEKKKDENKGEFRSISDNERVVFNLVRPGLDVRKLADLSCLGEFETCKALCNLVNLEYLRAVYPEGRAASLDGATPLLERVAGAVGRLVVSMVVLLALGFVISRVDFESVSFSSAPSSGYADPATQHFISRAQVSRIQAALEVYRLEKGETPDKLEALVETGLLSREDLRYPWREPYYYRRVSPAKFVLLAPLR